MRRAWLRTAAPLALCALALTACSDDDSGSDSEAAESSPAQQSESPPPADDEPSEPAAEESAPAGGEDQGPAPESQPGGERKEGESGIRAFEEEDGTPTYEMVAQGVDVGTNADALKLLPNQKDQVGDKLLAVAQVKFTNRGGDPVPEYPKVGDETELYVDGQPAQPLMMIGSAPEGCDRAVTIDTWPQGESHILCRSFLIPPTAKALEVRWGADGEDPFIWRFNR